MTMLAADPMIWLPSDDTPLLDAAIAYASHGFRVLPVWGVRFVDGLGICKCGRRECRTGGEQEGTVGKHPVERLWQKKATADADAVRDTRRTKSDANIGLAMGGPSRLVALDIDGEQGRQSWAELEAGVRSAPTTLTSRSGRADGGEHRIYCVPAHLDIKRLGNRASFRKMGIDTRIDNGQIVVAPSVHRTGARYTWAVRAPIADLPDWLFEALAAPIELGRSAPRAIVTPPSSAPASSPGGQLVDFVRPYIRKVIENAARDIAAGKPGQRNSLLFAKTCTVFEYHVGEQLDHNDAWRALSDAGRAAGLSDGEVSATLSKAWRKAQAQPRRVPPPQARAAVPSAAPIPAASESGPVSTGGGGGDDGGNWEATLMRTAEDQVKNTFGNICKILRHAEEYVGRLTFNQMRVTPCVDARPLRDTDLARVREDVELRWGFSPARDSVMQALGMVSEERSFHPVQDYLAKQTWDGSQRINRVAREVLGASAVDPLTQRMLRCWFISAVARAMSPGCKVDTTLVLVGDQSFRKSTFFATLGGEWFSDSYADVRTKDGVLQVHAAWIYEWAEIERITTRTSSSDVKAFLTVARDDVRPPYGLGIVNQPRSSVIVGSTNKPFLDDETGSRRFHPIKVEQRVDIALLGTWRDQLWAEAVAAYRSGETWWLSEAEDEQREHAAGEHMVENPWLERIARFAADPGRQQFGVSSADVLTGAFGLELGRISRGDETRVGKALRQLGWVARQEARGAARVRVYRPAQPRPQVVQVVQTVTSTTSSTSQPEQPSQPLSNSSQSENDRSEVSPLDIENGRAGCEVVQPSGDLSPSDEDESLSNWLERQP